MSLRDWLLRNSTFWRVNASAWMVFGMFHFAVRLALETPFRQAVVLSTTLLVVSLGLSGVMRRVYRRRALRPFRLVTVIWVLGVSALAALIQSGINQGIELGAGWKDPEMSLQAEEVARLVFGWIAFLAWSLGYLGMKAEIDARSQRELARSATDEARRIELQMLRAQLDPHFLFNALNGIATEIEPHPASAREMVHGLSEYLRYSLDHRNQSSGTLAAELDAVNAYLEIQRTRFGGRLHTQVEADARARRCVVPSFLLQPLVENAVKHGLEADAARCELRVIALSADASLHIEVRNSGRLGRGPHDGGGVGLETLRRRLDVQYPGRHRFSLADELGWVCARIELEGVPCFA